MDYYRTFPFTEYNWMYNQWTQNGFIQEDRILEDMEYLQQMYPTYAKKYQGVIKGAVDRVDYAGSFIYDQYPDKITLQQIINSIMTIIKTNEMNIAGTGEGTSQNINALSENAQWSDKEAWIKELVTVLLFYEILTRRRRNKRYL